MNHLLKYPHLLAVRAAAFRMTLVLAVAAGTWGPTSRVRAQEEKLPPAEQVLDDFVKATGGRQAYEKNHNVYMEGTFEMPTMGIKGKLTSWAAAPNKSYTLIEGEGLGKMEEGCDGKVAWSTSVMTGPQIAEGAERELKLRLNTFNAPLHWRKLYQKVECVGIEQVNERPCYKVVKTPPTGNPETEYYDKETKLLLKSEMTITTAMGDVPAETSHEDYKKVGDLLLSHKDTIKVMMMEQAVLIERVEFNVDMPKERFALPEDIKALLAKAQMKEKEGAQEQEGEKEQEGKE